MSKTVTAILNIILELLTLAGILCWVFGQSTLLIFSLGFLVAFIGVKFGFDLALMLGCK